MDSWMSTVSWRFVPLAGLLCRRADVSHSPRIQVASPISVWWGKQRWCLGWIGFTSIHHSISESNVLTCIENVTVLFDIKETHFSLCVDRWTYQCHVQYEVGPCNPRLAGNTLPSGENEKTYKVVPWQSRGKRRLECDGTRAETRFLLSTKRTSPFKSAGGVSSVDYWQPSCAHQR